MTRLTRVYSIAEDFLEEGILDPITCYSIVVPCREPSLMQEGDQKASFSEAAIEHLDALYGFAMAMTRNETESEDLVQETYLRAVRAFGQLMPDSNLKGWLFAIMRNVWLNQLRHARSGPHFIEIDAEEEGMDFPDVSGTDPFSIYLKKVERREVHAAIESLPLLHREIILLRDIEGFSYQQIAGILGCPAGTVMSRLGRAREKLRELLGWWRRESDRKTLRSKEA